MFKFRAFSVVLIVVALLLSVPAVLAQGEGGDVTEVPDLQDMLLLLSTGGGLGVIISWLLEHMEKFQGLSSTAKMAVVLLVSMVVPVAANLALQYVPQSAFEFIEPLWKSAGAGFLVFLATQGYYFAKKAASATIKA